MKKYLATVLIGLSGLVLGACDSSPAERASFQKTLDAWPPGQVAPSPEEPLPGTTMPR